MGAIAMVLLLWQNSIHGTLGLGNGLWALPWTSCCSELSEPHCNTAENPGSLLAKCCSCFLHHLNQVKAGSRSLHSLAVPG